MAADENQTILEATTINSQESSAASGVSSATSSGQTDTAAQTGVVSVTDADSSGSAKAAITGMDWLGLVLISFVLPAVLTWLIAIPLRKWGWIKDGDLKLDL